MLPALSPTSNRAPAQAARSPSPEQSMKMSAATAWRPALVSTISALMRRSSCITTPAPSAWKQNIDLVGGEQIVGGDLVGRGVVGLRQDFAEDQMRRVKPAEPIDPRQQIGRDALHHPMHLAMDIGVQPAEIRHPCRRAHAAEKPIALDQQRALSRARGGDRGGDAAGPPPSTATSYSPYSGIWRAGSETVRGGKRDSSRNGVRRYSAASRMVLPRVLSTMTGVWKKLISGGLP